jgi:hypothetical protein
MNFFAWMLALFTLVGLTAQAVAFHKSTICRQQAWLKGLELRTQYLLTDSKEIDQQKLFACQLEIVRKKDLVLWKRAQGDFHPLRIPLNGKL